MRPIIPYNPFPADYGDIQIESDLLSSFSELIDERIDTVPKKEKSFINHPKFQNSIICNNCNSKLNSKWYACPICGEKQS